ncbi:DUF4251 domain-containing protein [Cesiribacter sp. SM1]|uniref:DUF4251 domain-containing protein n=1 Tax=Cesiribacter sp. SM1 TaxID=2861196 RepID=UPI001CD1E41B|nr:DUF4251 domain-containing protein [Cesiribacter sp. SM1]
MKIFKIVLLGLALVFAAQAGWAQTSSREQKKIEKAERKRLKEEEERKNHELLVSLVKDQTYVLEATTLAGRYGYQYQVSPNTNFIMVEGDQVIVQTANNHGVGYNGLGGITINGTIRDYEVHNEKNGVSVMIRFQDPVLGLSTLNLSVQANGYARATVLGNWGARATFQGQFSDLEESRIFKGRPII